MMEGASCIFPSSHVRVRCILREDGDKRAFDARGSAHREIDHSVFPLWMLKVDTGLGSGRGVGNRSREFGAVTADKLFGAVDDHLRRIDFAQAERFDRIAAGVR